MKLLGCTGSLRYMAPECALSQPYNEKVDMYSLGIILYEVITACLPFNDYTKDEFYDHVIRGGERPVFDVGHLGQPLHIPEKIKDFVSSFWETLPQNRPTAKQSYEFFNQLLQSCVVSKSDVNKGKDSNKNKEASCLIA